MPLYYDRYKDFRANSDVKPIPGIKINPESTDKQEVWTNGKSRMDILSNEYYGNPYHGWLIMLANPQFGGMEFDIPDDEVIRIPFPFTNALERYTLGVKKHKDYYG